LAFPVLVELVEDAVAQAQSFTDLDNLSDMVVPIDQLLNKSTNTEYHPLASGMRWPTKSTDMVRVPVTPVHHHGLFRRDRTYLLVGLTGTIGQSLCAFMAANGAGCVCLVSRNVALDPA